MLLGLVRAGELSDAWKRFLKLQRLGFSRFPFNRIMLEVHLRVLLYRNPVHRCEYSFNKQACIDVSELRMLLSPAGLVRLKCTHRDNLRTNRCPTARTNRTWTSRP